MICATCKNCADICYPSKPGECLLYESFILPPASNGLLSAAIFSGDNSRELWEEINSLGATSTGDDIRDVLYSFGCAMQRLESKFEKEKCRNKK